MSTTLSSFIAGILRSPSPVDEQLQRNIYQSLVARKLWGQLGQLASRPDTSDELDTLLGSRKEIDVVVGWVSRPGRSADAIVSKVAGEKRVKALLTIASRPDLPADVYHGVGRHTSKTLAEALVRNVSVPRELRVAKAAELVNNPTMSSWRLREMFRDEALAGDESFTRDVATRVTNLSGISLMLDIASPSPETILGYCDVVVAAKPDDDEIYYSRSTSYEDTLLELSRHRLDEKRRKKLATALRKAARENTHWSYMRSRLEEAAVLVSSQDDTLFDQIERFEAETDPERAATLFAELHTASPHPEMLSRIIAVMARHESLPLEVGFPHFEHADYSTQQVMIAQWVRRGAYGYLAKACVGWYYRPHWLSEFSNFDVVAFLTAIGEEVRSSGSEYPHWVLYFAERGDQVSALVDAIPWPNLVSAMPELPALAEEVETRLRGKLASSPSFWESFETLADEFEGTFPELVETASSL